MSAHKSGSGCPNCAKNLKYTKERVLEKMNSIHNKVEQRYAYDLTEYKNTNQKYSYFFCLHKKLQSALMLFVNSMQTKYRIKQLWVRKF